MKKIYFLFFVAFTSIINAQCPTFSINAPSGTTVGCVPPTTPLNAVNTSTLSSVTYTWISSSTGTTTGSSINASSPSATNVYTIIASAPSTTCFSTQTFTVVSNKSVPFYSIVFTPTAITCSSPTISMAPFTSFPFGPPITFTFTSPPPTSTANVAGATFSVPGTYTMNYTNTSNGCTAATMTNVPLNLTPPSFTLAATQPTCSSCCNGQVNVSPSSAYTYTLNGVSQGSSTSYSGLCNGKQVVCATHSSSGCIKCDSLTLAWNVGIVENSWKNKLKLFPNPNSGSFQLQMDSEIKNGEFVLINLLGQKIYEQEVKQGINNIDLNGILEGLYQYFILENKKQIYTSKLRVE